MIPAMTRAGYDKAFATAIAVSSGVLGPLIPPSIAFVIWGVIAEQSIGRLFLSGVVPGLAIAAGLLVVCYVHARRHKVPLEAARHLARDRQAFWDAKWALMSPVIVLGGIYGGVFTPTEAAGVSCVYAILVGLLVERQLTLRGLPDLFIRAVRTSAMVTAIVAVSTGFGVLVAQDQIAVKFAEWLAGQRRPALDCAGRPQHRLLPARRRDGRDRHHGDLRPDADRHRQPLRGRSGPFRRDHRHQRRHRHGGAADRLLPVRRHGDQRPQSRRGSRAGYGRMILVMLIVLFLTTYVPQFALFLAG